MTIKEIDKQSGRGWNESEHQDLAKSVFRKLEQNDLKLLREWDPDNDFETWLIVLARRMAFRSSIEQL